ncbi:hypothetical protein QUF72_13045 [Desulfobacterales bacterium HSG2]|nr:hypothetical protein [Desulfobacterales bacterium HSG2]
MIKKDKLKVIGGIVLVFLIGVLVGALGTGICIRHKIERFAKASPDKKRMFVMKKLSAKLDLTSSQSAEIEKIVGNALNDLHKYRKEYLEKIIEPAVTSIKEKLNNEQRKKLDRLHERLKRYRPPH